MYFATLFCASFSDPFFLPHSALRPTPLVCPTTTPATPRPSITPSRSTAGARPLMASSTGSAEILGADTTVRFV
jgi:hypothetical protein